MEMAIESSVKKRELTQNFSKLGEQQFSSNAGKDLNDNRVPEDIELIILESDYLYKKVGRLFNLGKRVCEIFEWEGDLNFVSEV